MKFLCKYKVWFYTIPFILGLILYLLGQYLIKEYIVFVIAFVFLFLGLIMFEFSCVINILDIYKTYIYETPQQKYLNAQKIQTEPEFAEFYYANKEFKKKMYKTKLRKNIFYGIFVFIVLISIILAICF